VCVLAEDDPELVSLRAAAEAHLQTRDAGDTRIRWSSTDVPFATYIRKVYAVAGGDHVAARRMLAAGSRELRTALDLTRVATFRQLERERAARAAAAAAPQVAPAAAAAAGAAAREWPPPDMVAAAAKLSEHAAEATASLPERLRAAEAHAARRAAVRPIAWGGADAPFGSLADAAFEATGRNAAMCKRLLEAGASAQLVALLRPDDFRGPLLSHLYKIVKKNKRQVSLGAMQPASADLR